MGKPTEKTTDTKKNKETQNTTTQDKVTLGKTSTTENNTVAQKITRKKSLYVMMPYVKGGKEKSFLKAAKHKVTRLKHLYPNAEYWVESFTTLGEFKAIWKKIYDATTKDEKSKYDLCGLHYFGHSGHDALYVQDNTITYAIIELLEKLRWNKDKGTLVLNSCRSGRYEDNPKDERGGRSQNCIAKALSIHQQTKVIGQMVYATFTTGDTVEELKYRNGSFTNKLSVDIWGSDNLALWGYKSGGKVDNYKNDAEYKLLDDWQIWPCRLFNNGESLIRLIGSNTFNDTDLLYI